jgi:fructokinase
MSKVWVTGDAVVDLIPEGGSTYLKCPGGAPANVAVAIAKLGGQVSFLGRIGDDPLGRFMCDTLIFHSVSTENLIIDPEYRTSTVIVDLDDQGERSFTFMVKPSADQFFCIEDIPIFEDSEWLHCCSIALANEPSRSATFAAMEKIKASGGFVSFDPNIRDEVWSNSEDIIPAIRKAIELADVVKFSEDELEYLTGSTDVNVAMDILSMPENVLVVVTKGANGALVIFDGKQKLISGKQVIPIDTTGAGDAFVGGMLFCLSSVLEWNTWPNIETAVHWGNICGALATTQKGAMTALPSLNELKMKLTAVDTA